MRYQAFDLESLMQARKFSIICIHLLKFRKSYNNSTLGTAAENIFDLHVTVPSAPLQDKTNTENN